MSGKRIGIRNTLGTTRINMVTGTRFMVTSTRISGGLSGSTAPRRSCQHLSGGGSKGCAPGLSRNENMAGRGGNLAAYRKHGITGTSAGSRISDRNFVLAAECQGMGVLGELYNACCVDRTASH